MQEKSLSEAEIVKLSMKEKAARRILRWGEGGWPGHSGTGTGCPLSGEGHEGPGLTLEQQVGKTSYCWAPSALVLVNSPRLV